MKCNNCGFENNSGSCFCGSCGKPLNHNTASIQQSEQVSSSNKKKKKIIVIGSIVVCILLVVVVVKIVNNGSKFKDPFPEVDDLSVANMVVHEEADAVDKSFTSIIEKDYKNGFLSTDEYIMQLAYSVFDTDKLGENYKSLDLDYYPSEFFNEVEKKVDELSDETILYLYKLFSLSNLQWDDDSVDGTETGYSVTDDYKAVPLADRELTTDETNLGKLNHVKLSSGGHFLIYYTTDGRNAVDESDVDTIASHLEKVVDDYKRDYGLNFEYSIHYEPFSRAGKSLTCQIGTSRGHACLLLEKYNIDINYLDTAMPVFIASTKSYNSAAMAYYMPSLARFYEIALAKVLHNMGLGDCNLSEDREKCLASKTATAHISTTYAFPFFVVSSDIDSIEDSKIVSAHELFHHYQKYICGDGSYSQCQSDLFTVETTANYAPIRSWADGRSDEWQGWARYYDKHSDESIDTVGSGYAAYPFAYNYAKIVDGGESALFNSLKYGDSLAYLKNQSGGKYKDVMLTTAIKSLTKDYNHILLESSSYPPNHYNFGTEDIKSSDDIAYSSSHYYYIHPLEYGEKTQISFSSSTSDLTLVLFILEDGDYRNVYTHSLNEEFVINPFEFGYYGELVFSIVDSATSGHDTYDYEVDTDGKKIPTVTPSSLGLKTMDALSKYSSFICYQVEDKGSYRNIIQVKLSFDKKDKINDMYVKGTLFMNNSDPDNPAFQIAQRIGTEALRLLEKTYKEQFKYYEVMTYEGKDRYSVIFKIKKNYYEALNNALSVEGEDKVSIIKSLQADRFICSYYK